MNCSQIAVEIGDTSEEAVNIKMENDNSFTQADFFSTPSFTQKLVNCAKIVKIVKNSEE